MLVEVKATVEHLWLGQRQVGMIIRWRQPSAHGESPRWSGAPGRSTAPSPRPIPTPTASSTSAPRSSSWSRRSSRPRAPTSGSTWSRRPLFARYPDAAAYAAADRAELEEMIKLDRLLPGQDRQPDQAGRGARRAVRRRGAGHAWPSWSRCPASVARRRTWCSATPSAFPASPSTPTSAGWPGGSAGRSRPIRSRSRPRSARCSRRKDWTQLCHHVIWHGRRRCHARNPACGACPVARWCPAYGEGETDPVKAAKLVREPRG